MKVTARAEYASLAVLELALRDRKGPVQARQIAAERKIPLKFLEQILSQLRQAGLVQSIRGVFGGYRLARPAHEITLKQIVEAVEGPFRLVGDRVGDETLTRVWNEVEDGFCNVLGAITIQELMLRKLKEGQVPDFQI